MREYDVAIIGSGPAGNVAAKYFAKSAKRIAWFEESARQPIWPPFSGAEIASKYRNGGQQMILSYPPVAVGEPTSVGGGLDINAGLFQRPLERTYENWKIGNNTSWSWSQIEKEFDLLESEMIIDEIPIKDNVVSQLMQKGAENLNWSYKNVPILSLSARRNYVQQNIKSIIEQGGDFYESARVDVVQSAGSGWVLYSSIAGQQQKIFAKNIFLAAGTLQTPALLYRSGLLASAYSNFCYHPVVKMIAEFTQSFDNSRPHFSPVQIKNFSPEVSIGASMSFKATLLTEHIKAGQLDPKRLNAFTSQLMFYVSTSANPKTHMLHFKKCRTPFLFCFHQQINKKMQKAMQSMLEFGSAMGARDLYIGKRKFSATALTSKESFSAATPVTAIHLFSSLPMGDKAHHCVNLNGQLRGHPNIYVIDGSILPSSPGVNPQETIMAFAQKIVRESAL